MSFVYTRAKVNALKADLDFDEAGHDMRVLLVRVGSTAATQEDATTISGFTTLNEFDGAAYVRKALASQVVNEDTVNNRGEFDAPDVVWTALGAGSSNCIGAVIFRFVTNDADSVPIAYIDAGGFPFNGNGGDVTLAFNVEGILQAT